MPARQDAAAAKADIQRREEELAQLKKKHNIGEDVWSNLANPPNPPTSVSSRISPIRNTSPPIVSLYRVYHLQVMHHFRALPSPTAIATTSRGISLQYEPTFLKLHPRGVWTYDEALQDLTNAIPALI